MHLLSCQVLPDCFDLVVIKMGSPTLFSLVLRDIWNRPFFYEYGVVAAVVSSTLLENPQTAFPSVA